MDEKRPLDKEGIEQCRDVGRWLNSLDTHVDLILTSPLKRATQTAALVGNEIAYEQRIEADSGAAPRGRYESFRQLLKQISRSGGGDGGGAQSEHERVSFAAGDGRAERAWDRDEKGQRGPRGGRSKRAVLNWLITPRLVKSVYTSAQSQLAAKYLEKIIAFPFQRP